MIRFCFALLFCLSLLLPSKANAQWYIGVKFIGISWHLKPSKHPHLFKGKLDKKGQGTVTYGIALSCEYRFKPYWSVKFDQCIFADCAGRFAGTTMLMPRLNVPFGKLGEGTGGIGPFFYYRRNWHELDGYVEDGLFKQSKNKRWQTKFIWYGGELEHNYPITERMDISTNLLPAVPVLFTLTPGVRWRVSDAPGN
ncbi:MAG: hypothetical protein ACRCYO_02855 [Bacteroidia bacterium]